MLSLEYSYCITVSSVPCVQGHTSHPRGIPRSVHGSTNTASTAPLHHSSHTHLNGHSAAEATPTTTISHKHTLSSPGVEGTKPQLETSKTKEPSRLNGFTKKRSLVMDSSSVRGYTHRPAGREGSLDSKKGSTFSPPSTADQAKLDSKAASLLPRIV